MAARFGKGRNIRLARRKPRSKVGQMLQDWHQDYSSDNIDFASLGSGSDVDVTLIDNSADFSNSILKWSKLTIRMVWEPENVSAMQGRVLAMGLLKEDQDDTSNTYALDNEETVRELRRDNKLVRGPWLVTPPSLATSGFIPAMTYLMKPIVLSSFVMDREEDLVIGYTNLGTAFASGTKTLRHFTQGWVRVLK